MWSSGGGPIDRFAIALVGKKGHQQRSAIIWDLARSPQVAAKNKLKDYVCGLFEGHVWCSGGAPFDRFVTVFVKKRGHQQRSAIFWDLARSPQEAVKKIR